MILWDAGSQYKYSWDFVDRSKPVINVGLDLVNLRFRLADWIRTSGVIWDLSCVAYLWWMYGWFMLIRLSAHAWVVRWMLCKYGLCKYLVNSDCRLWDTGNIFWSLESVTYFDPKPNLWFVTIFILYYLDPKVVHFWIYINLMYDLL